MLRQITLTIASFVFLKAGFAQTKCDSTSFYQAVKFSQNGDINNAIEKYSEQIKGCPNFYEAYINRAVCYYNQKQKKLFNEDFQKAIEVAYDKATAYSSIASFFFTIERYDTAFILFKKVTSFDTTNSDAYFKMGRCKWLERINILQANNVEDYATDPVFKSYLKDEILGYYDKAIFLDSSINNQHYLSRTQMETFQDANSNYQYYYYRGLFKLNFIDYEGSLKDFEKSIQIHPTINAYEYAAYLAKKVGNNKKACDYIQAWSTMFNPSEDIDPFKKREIADKFCNDIGIKTK